MTFRKLIEMPRFMLDHHWTKSHLSEEIDGQLGPEDRGRLMRHVDECHSCHRLLDSLRQTVSALRSASFRSKPGVADRVIEKLDEARVRPGSDGISDEPTSDPPAS